jgi:8-oxo-dGTP pyrophosphatase MutT (NUDIX family)
LAENSKPDHHQDPIWVTLVAREVEFSPDSHSETYHSLQTFDYVIVLAFTPDGRIPLVRQYRPAVEEFTFELPGGIIDTAEDAASTASRELLEETGFRSRVIPPLGVAKNDAGRLDNRIFSFSFRPTRVRSTLSLRTVSLYISLQ